MGDTWDCHRPCSCDAIPSSVTPCMGVAFSDSVSSLKHSLSFWVPWSQPCLVHVPGWGVCFSLFIFLEKIIVDGSTCCCIWFVPMAAVLAINRYPLCIFHTNPSFLSPHLFTTWSAFYGLAELLSTWGFCVLTGIQLFSLLIRKSHHECYS